jgi:hypothetical protein
MRTLHNLLLHRMLDPSASRASRYTAVRALPQALCDNSRTVKLIAIFLASWIVGRASYLGSPVRFYGQTISPGDLSSGLLWSLSFCR